MSFLSRAERALECGATPLFATKSEHAGKEKVRDRQVAAATAPQKVCFNASR